MPPPPSAYLRHDGSRRKPLSDSQIFGDLGADFYRVEAVEPMTHDSRPGLSVIAGPSAEASDDPASEGERAFGMRVLLALGSPFQALAEGLEEGGVVGFEAIVLAL